MTWTTPRTWIPGETPSATIMNQHIRDNLNSILPVASLVYRVANATIIETVVENRFLECNGVAVSRTTYAALFAYLNGLTPALPFGGGDGSTTFNIPDLRGRVPIHLGSTGSHTEVTTLGATEGVALSARRPRHATHLYASTAVGSQAQAARGAFGAGEQYIPVGNVGAAGTYSIDTPAYLVGGVWFIKYTA